MSTDDLNELAGRIEGMARVVFHLVAQLEDAGVIDGPAMTGGLRNSIVVNDDSGILMHAAKRTLNNAANALDEARKWRKFRRQITELAKRPSSRRKAAQQAG